MTKKLTEVKKEDDLLETAVSLIELGGNEMNVVAYQTAGVFATLSIAVSLKRLADMKEMEMNWAAGNYGFTGDNQE
jgi:hypothetical protein